jgi:hypothetical protein
LFKIIRLAITRPSHAASRWSGAPRRSS